MASLLTSWSPPSLQPGAQGHGQAVPRPGFPGRAVPALNTFVLGSRPSSLPCSPSTLVARQGVLSPRAFTLYQNQGLCCEALATRARKTRSECGSAGELPGEKTWKAELGPSPILVAPKDSEHDATYQNAFFFSFFSSCF